MSKYKRQIVKEIQKKHEFEEAQKELKKKHHIDEEEERIVVEKSSFFRVLMKTIGTVIRILATIAIAVLAVIGLAGIIYPAPRGELLKIGMEMYAQLRTWLPI